MCVCTCFRIYTQSCTQNLHVYVCMVTYIHRESTCGCVKISIYAPSVHMYVCIYLRLCVQSSNIHVGVYVFTCRHAEFGCGDVCAYIPAEFDGCVYTFVCLRVYVSYMHTEFTCVCVYILVYTYSVCMYVYTFAYMYTEFTGGCVHIYV